MIKFMTASALALVRALNRTTSIGKSGTCLKMQSVLHLQESFDSMNYDAGKLVTFVA